MSPPPPDPPSTLASQGTPRAAGHALAGATSAVNSEAATLAAAAGDALPPLRPPLVAGDLGAFGRHRVVRLLGRGGMGAVYEAVDTALGRPVALKLMLPAQAASPIGRERFLREARAAAAIRHENVVQVYQVGEDDGTPFLTMELLEGDHLARLIGRGLPATDVVRIGREVALGLAAAHKIGVVHRDVKPANVWIEAPGGRARLLDFGLARLGGEPDTAAGDGPPADAGLTLVGELLGTPMYMSPEQVGGEPIDFRSDLFSLGAVLYQMATGSMPFGKAAVRWVEAIRTGTYAPVGELAPTTPPALARLIHALLAPRPEDRPASAAAVADELLAIGTQLLIEAGSAVPIPVPPTPAADPTPQFDFTGPAEPVEHRRTPPPTRLLLGSATALVAVLLLIGVVHRVQTARHPPPAPPVDGPTPAMLAPPPNPLPKGFASLFNGRDLAGWRPPAEGPSTAWSVENGVLVGTPRPNFLPQALLSERDYADFELRLEYRWATPGGHTLVLLRANDDKQRYGKGLSVSLADDEGYPAVHGREVGAGFGTGVVLGLTSKPPAANKPLGEWNALRVVARRHVVEVELNGTRMPTANVDDKLDVLKTQPEYSRARGPVGLMCYVGTVEYRNVMIRPFPQ